MRESFLYRAYLYTFLNNLVLIYPLYSIYFQDNGLSAGQIGMALMFWSLSTILLQLPIGILSDRMSRRDMLIVGNGIVALAFFIFMTSPTFAGVLTGFGLWGIKWAIDAVCFQPMVYDRVRSKEKYLSIVGTCESVALAGTSVSALGSFLMFIGYDFITWCTIGIMMVAVLVLLSMPRDCHKCRRNAGPRMGLSELGKAAKFVFVRPELLGIMGLLSILNAAWNLDDWLGLIAVQLGYPEYAVGTLYFLAMLCGVIGGLAVRGLRHVGNMFVPTLVAGAGMLVAVASIYYDAWSTIALCMFWLLLSMSKNIIYADFQNSVATGVRGRVTAILEIMLECGTIFGYMIMTASASTVGGYKHGLYALGTMLIITSLWLAYRNRRKKQA